MASSKEQAVPHGPQMVADRPPALDSADAPRATSSRPASGPRAWVRRHPSGAALVPSLALAAMVTREAAWRAPDGALHWSLFDDAMISMSYARTLAHSGELVWFPGAPRTEGMTNLGWALVMAVLHALGLSGDAVVLAVVAIGLVVVWTTAFQTRTIVGTLAGTDDPRTRFLAVLAVATCFPLLWWTMRGMEVGLLTLLTFLAVNAVAALVRGEGGLPRRDAAVLVAVIAAGVVVRTDFAVVAGSIFLWLIVRRPSSRHRSAALLVVLATAASMVACLVFRLAYYGDPVPNTYYLKLSGFVLSDRLERGALTTAVAFIGYFLGPAIVVIAGWSRLSGGARDLGRLMGLLALTGLLYAVSVGGDAWEYFLLPNRYLTPSLVLLLVLVVGVLRAPSPSKGAAQHRRWRRVLAAAVVAAGAGPTVIYAAVLRWPRPDLAIVALPDETTWFAVALPALLAALILAGILLRAGTTPEEPTQVSGRVLVAVVVLFAASGAVAAPGLAFTHLDNAANYSVLGYQIAQVTNSDATVAVVAAGATQYVSGRDAVDLLGKSDEHIAKGPAAATDLILPGHNKYDFAYSIGQLHPDLVAQVWRELGPDDLLRWGYRPYRLADGEFGAAAYAVCDGHRVMWARPQSHAIRWDRLLPVDPARCRRP